MSDKLYRIRELVWGDNQHDAGIVATTEIGIYKVALTVGDYGYSWEGLSFGRVVGRGKCENIELAKLAAEAHWVSRIEGCLEVAE